MSISFTVTKSGGGTAVLGTDYLYDGIETLIFLTSCSFTSSTNLIISNLVVVGGGGKSSTQFVTSNPNGGGGGGGGQVYQTGGSIKLSKNQNNTVTIGGGNGSSSTCLINADLYTANGGVNTGISIYGGARYGYSGYTGFDGQDGVPVDFSYKNTPLTIYFGGGGGGISNMLYGYLGGNGGGGGSGYTNRGMKGGNGINGGGGGGALNSGKPVGYGGDGVNLTNTTIFSIGQSVPGASNDGYNGGIGGDFNGGQNGGLGGVGGANASGGAGGPNTGGGGGGGWSSISGGSGIVILSFTLPYPCFLKSSKILTNYGYIPIEDLKKGDLVKTLLHDFKPIAMIGKKEIYHSASKERIANQLYQCSRDNYPELLEPLVLTGCHSILVENSTSVVDAEQIEKVIAVNGGIYLTDDKLRLPACVDEKTTVFPNEGTYTIYHIALENDDYYMNYGIYANGLLVETTSKRYIKELSGMTLI